jgi:hypothetical protein
MSTDGLRELQAALDKKLIELQGVTEKAIKEVTLDLLGKSVKLAPVKEGDLRGSGKADFSEDGMTGVVSFGTVYARRQHEELTWKHPQGGQAKYLQQPFEENMEKYVQRLADDVRGETK